MDRGKVWIPRAVHCVQVLTEVDRRVVVEQGTWFRYALKTPLFHVLRDAAGPYSGESVSLAKGFEMWE